MDIYTCTSNLEFSYLDCSDLTNLVIKSRQLFSFLRKRQNFGRIKSKLSMFMLCELTSDLF